MHLRQTNMTDGPVRESVDALSAMHTFADEGQRGCFTRSVLVVAGPPGAGKSSLLAQFVAERRARSGTKQGAIRGEEFVLAHYASSSPQAQRLLAAVTRWVWILGSALGQDVTEWRRANRSALEAMVSGEMSEQSVMAVFKRYLTLIVAQSSSGGGGRSARGQVGVGGNGGYGSRKGSPTAFSTSVHDSPTHQHSSIDNNIKRIITTCTIQFNNF